MNFKTSHVIVYLKGTDMVGFEFADFKTSHVIVYLYLPHNTSHEITISKHLMLLFITVQERGTEDVV